MRRKGREKGIGLEVTQHRLMKKSLAAGSGEECDQGRAKVKQLELEN